MDVSFAEVHSYLSSRDASSDRMVKAALPVPYHEGKRCKLFPSSLTPGAQAYVVVLY